MYFANSFNIIFVDFITNRLISIVIWNLLVIVGKKEDRIQTVVSVWTPKDFSHIDTLNLVSFTSTITFMKHH